MSYTLTEYDALKAAYAKGVTYVSYNGQAVTYAKREDMAARLRDMERELGITGDAVTTASQRVIYAGRIP